MMRAGCRPAVGRAGRWLRPDLEIKTFRAKSLHADCHLPVALMQQRTGGGHVEPAPSAAAQHGHSLFGGGQHCREQRVECWRKRVRHGDATPGEAFLQVLGQDQAAAGCRSLNNPPGRGGASASPSEDIEQLAEGLNRQHNRVWGQAPNHIQCPISHRRSVGALGIARPCVSRASDRHVVSSYSAFRLQRPASTGRCLLSRASRADRALAAVCSSGATEVILATGLP